MEEQPKPEDFAAAIWRLARAAMEPLPEADWKVRARAEAAAATLADHDHWALALLERVGLPREGAVWEVESAYLIHLWLDGEQFRLLRSPFGRRTGFWGDHLVLVRACVECGEGQFASRWLNSLADVGRALDGHQPRCRRCRG